MLWHQSMASMSPEQELSFVQALTQGERSAVEQFEREFLGPLDHQLKHMKLDSSLLDEVKQRVRERLLLASPEQPARIASYAGQGKLGGLVLVTATRIAVDLLRARSAEPAKDSLRDDHDSDWLGVSAKSDPVLAKLKQTALTAFKEAFAESVGALDARERNLLRQHHLHGVSLEKLGEMYQVHRATIVRWLSAAREKVLLQTRKKLSVSMELSTSDMDSVMGLLESQMDASVERLLRSQAEPET